MNLKNITNLFISLFLLASCSKFENLNKKSSELDTTVIEEIETQDIISNINYYTYENFIDYYSRNINFKWNNSKKLEKNFTLSIGKNPNTDLNVSNFIIDNKYIYFINDKFIFSKVNLLDGNVAYEIKLDLIFNPDLSLPISIAKIDDFFFAGFANGLIIKFNETGNIYWELDFADLLRTPIKIQNNNILVMFNSNRNVLINSEDGSLIWEYYYGLDKTSSAEGGSINSKDNILFLLMPNGRIGAIDTIIGEKIELDYLSKIQQLNIFNNNYKANIHINDIFFSFLEDKSRIYTFNMNNEKFALFNEKILSIDSYDFINNALLILNKNNLLKAYNLNNNKIFWKTDLSDILSNDNKILDSFISNDSLIIFFSKGFILQLNRLNGEIIFKQNLRLSEITFINSYYENFAISLKNGKNNFL